MAGLTFADLLGLLGHGDGDFTSVCYRPVGGAFSSRVVPSGDAAAIMPAAWDYWFGVNPLTDPETWPENKGRGTAGEVSRLVALHADLDVKIGGMVSMEAAGDLVNELSTMLGTRPVAMVLSGHGVQPYWAIEDGPSGGEARALLRRWGRLVAHVAGIQGSHVDPVYDLSRVLRVPGTMNYKSTPVPVLGIRDRGRALAVEEADDALRAYGCVELPGDRDEPGNIAVNPPANWQWAPLTCTYAVGMAGGWRNDHPTARHPWLLAQSTRIAAGHRNGCYNAAGHNSAVAALVDRFRDLLSHGPEARKESPGEIADALGWGQTLAAAKTDAEIATELGGGHSHEPADADIYLAGGSPFVPPQESAYQNEPTEDEIFASRVADAAFKLRVGAAARALVAAEQAGEAPPFDAGTLGEILQRPAEPPYRAEGLIPNEASALIVAMRKTGKTTLNLNLARSYILGEDFLGRFPVRPITGNVGLLNYEVSSAQIARWAHEVGIPHDRLCVVNLRGRRNPLGNDEDKEKLADWLRGHSCESLIVDPFGRAYTGVSQNDSGEVGAWLADLDRWARGEVGVVDLALSVHAGWEGERSRGASALEDWGDTIITMTRRKAGEGEEEEDGHRYLRAEGRDVDVDEDQLDYDPMTRLLTLSGSGGRRVASINLRVEKLVPVVVEYVDSNPACSQRDLESSLPYRAVDIRKAAEVAAFRGLITRTVIGKGFSHMSNSPNSRSEERVRPCDTVASGDLGASDAVTAQYVDTTATVVSLFQAGEEVRPTASRVRPGRTASTASPATIGAGRETHPRGPCKNPAHTPVIRRGRWECPDCDREQGGVVS